MPNLIEVGTGELHSYDSMEELLTALPQFQQEGKRVRFSFSTIHEVHDMPDLIEIQKRSYEWFLKEGLMDIFDDISPITDFTGNLVLEFLDYSLDEPKYSVEECKDRDVTYAAPLRVRVRLINKDTGEVKEQEVFMGDFPLMTGVDLSPWIKPEESKSRIHHVSESSKGTFVINGAERVVVSQLVRSPGVYYSQDVDKQGNVLYSATIIPNRGAWIELESNKRDYVTVRVDRTRKQPVTLLLTTVSCRPHSIRTTRSLKKKP